MDAIQAGVLQADGTLPGAPLGKSGLGEKPKMWDVWMDVKAPIIDDQHHVKDQEHQDAVGIWQDVMVSRAILSFGVRPVPTLLLACISYCSSTTHTHDVNFPTDPSSRPRSLP